MARTSARTKVRAAMAAGGMLAIAADGAAQTHLVIDLAQLGTVHPGFVVRVFDFDTQELGRSVSGAGDVNGDGLADVILGAYGTNNWAGASWVVFGKANNTAVDIHELGAGGFRIDGIDAHDWSGRSVSGAGDVNGDGLADIVVGAMWADAGGDSNAGETYVVFGKADNTTIALGALGSNGFRIDGIDTDDYSGIRVSGAGDVNGDGLADLIVGADSADPDGDARAGESYVVFGKTSNSAVDLNALGDGGFGIDGIDAGDRCGWSVAGAGDVNGDGLADLVVGAPQADPSGRNSAGETFVVFGKATNSPVDLDALGNAGFRIDGAGGRSGAGVSGAGDVNGDGLADLVVGAYLTNPAGASYVVFGKADDSPVDLAALGNAGFRIDGIDPSDRAGYSVSGAGDVNGDGLSDLIVGAYAADIAANYGAGESYVVFGKTTASTVELDALGSGGFRMNGVSQGDYSGYSVSAAGDVNGDGLADVVVGAKWVNGFVFGNTGRGYVVFSPPPSLPAAATYRSVARANDAPRVAVGISGDGSDDDSPSSRCWIDFADGSGPGLDGSSMQTVTLHRGAVEPPGQLNVHWELATDRADWTDAVVALRYTDAEISNASEGGLRLLHGPTADGPWTELDATFDVARNRATVTVSELGFFALASEPELDAFVIE